MDLEKREDMTTVPDRVPALEEATQPGLPSALIQDAIKQWCDSLVNLDGRNPLLRFRDLRVGTISLPVTGSSFVNCLATGSTVDLQSLVLEREKAGDDPVADYQKKARSIYKKGVENLEERGISTPKLAAGLVVGLTVDGKPVRAPLLVQAIQISPLDSTHSRFRMKLDTDVAPVEFNPVLLRHLENEGHSIDYPTLEEAVESARTPIAAFASAWSALERMVGPNSAYTLEDQLVIGNFSYAALPIVTDLEGAAQLASDSDVVLSLAGDTSARERARGEGSDASIHDPDNIPPADEFLILDADSSQNRVINSALNGRNLIVQGPPGTGKSQTIANLIATLAARGKTALFVAEKQAAIEAVVKRLESTGLGHLVLDMHDPSSSKGQIRKQLRESFDLARRTLPTTENHATLASIRTALIESDRSLHAVREPWSLSAFAAINELSGLEAHEGYLIPTRLLPMFTEDVRLEVSEMVRDAAERGAFGAAFAASGWADANLDSADAAQQAIDLARGIAHESLPDVKLSLRRLLRTTRLQEPTSLSQWRDTFSLIGDAQRAVDTFTADIFSLDLQAMTAAFASGSWRKQNGVEQGWLARRRNRKLIKTIRIPSLSKKETFDALVSASRTATSWFEESGTSIPELPEDWATSLAEYTALRETLESLGAIVGMSELPERQIAEMTKQADHLAQSGSAAIAIPILRKYEARLSELGLLKAYQDLRGTDTTTDHAVEMIRFVILSNLLDSWRLHDESLQSRTSEALDERADTYRRLDSAHIESTAARVARRVAENVVHARSENVSEDALLANELQKSRRLKSTRDLIDDAEPVILAAKPCWAMSPLTVSQVLPRRQLFDVVIFDEASQVEPAYAIPTILRGKQVVVAGDRHQLPPTRFFAAETDAEAEDAPEIAAYESLIDALAGTAREANLQWHYRSQDERLIAVSNQQIYGQSLVTFPGAKSADCLKFVEVPSADTIVEDGSSSAEVAQVVEEVLDHARNRPTESLGVIAPGAKHANRVDAAVRDAIQENPDLRDWFSDDRTDPFFVKNLERVQGDERDAIIITTGYSRRTNGRLQQAFGPINQKGGERRLNVAASRARKRMTLVSSFSSADLDPEAQAPGRKFLRALFEFIESDGTNMSVGPTGDTHLNPFELHIYDSLRAADLDVICQYGVSGYKIDFVIQHPTRPGDFVLAVEADGAQYHSSPTARDRDRLRQEHLERLGWTFHRIWSTAWFSDPAHETQRVVAAYQEALSGSGDKGAKRKVESMHPAVAAPVPQRRTAPFSRATYESVTDYSDTQLVEFATWVRSDGKLRTREEAVREMSEYMGFARLGPRIREYLEWAWDESQPS